MGIDQRLSVFHPPDCLYRDHLGRRIVADWEGSGALIAWVENGSAWLESEDGTILLESGPAKFRGYGLVISDESAVVQVAIGSSVESDAGLQCDAVSGMIINDNHEPLPCLLKEVSCFPWRGVLLDAFDIGDLSALNLRSWQVQNLTEKEVLTSTFRDGTSRSAETASHLNAAHWTCQVPDTAQTVVLRKYYDRFHGRQRARVKVNGRVAGMWYEPIEDRQNRWGIGDFFIDWNQFKHEGAVAFSIDPPSGTPLWSVSRIEIWSVESS